MNHVTCETAARLKEAGFPQPAPEAGQFWWFVRYPEGTLRTQVVCVIIDVWKDFEKSYCMKPLDGGNLEGKQEFIFAPTATDILRELGMSYWQRFHEEDGVFYVFADKYWEDSFGDTVGAFVETSRHQNPAEAAAQAWLKLNEQ